MTIQTVLEQLRLNREFVSQVMAWERIPARSSQMAETGTPLSPQIRQALTSRGITSLYRHQAEAIDAALRGENVVVATGTASGKTLAYNVPVLETLLAEPSAQALYIFPTKALAHDQVAEAASLVNAGSLPIRIHSYDGDTPRGQRRQVRTVPGIVVTNPDMLHSGILPYHTGWRQLFANLRFVVVDEIHTYREIGRAHV